MAAESGRDTVKSCVRLRFSSEMFRGISTNVTSGISDRCDPQEDISTRLEE